MRNKPLSIRNLSTFSQKLIHIVSDSKIGFLFDIFISSLKMDAGALKRGPSASKKGQQNHAFSMFRMKPEVSRLRIASGSCFFIISLELFQVC